MVAEVEKDISPSPVSGLVLEAPFNSMYKEVGHDGTPNVCNNVNTNTMSLLSIWKLPYSYN